MAICGSCGRQTVSADACPACRADAPATLLVAAHPAIALRTSDRGSPLRHYSTAQLYAQAHRYWPTEPDRSAPADPGWRLLHGQDAAEAYALPQFDATAPENQPPSPNLKVSPPSGRWIALIAAAAVLLVTTVVATVLVERYQPVAHAARADRPSATVRSATAAPATVAAIGHTQLSAGQASPTAAEAAAVAASLHRYFNAINHHDYGLYRRLFIPALRGGLSAASFRAEFGATAEAGEQLTTITVLGRGEVEAAVTLISRQLTASPANSTCTAWSVDFYLGWRGYRYQLVAPPVWSQGSYHNCS